ncbi:MAG: B12-binding domain-containing radical SAM protein [Planctomycetota bacterium]|jgi:radical SAM superfamily enzyme YgiQ (UPF0313 family)
MRIALREVAADGYPHFGWNYYAGECLKGHALGVFSDASLDVDLGRLRTPSDLDLLTKEAGKYDMVGLTVAPGTLSHVDRAVSRIADSARKPGLLVLGGQLPTYYPGELLERYRRSVPRLAIVQGEGEKAFEDLIRYQLGHVDIRRVPGIRYAAGSEVVQTMAEPTPLSELVHPASFDTVDSVVASGYPSAMLHASRGCHWGSCSYCTRTSFRNPGIDASALRSPGCRKRECFRLSRVRKELETLVQRRISSLEFADDEFIGGRGEEELERGHALATLLKDVHDRAGKKLSCRFFTRPDVVFRADDHEGNGRVARLLGALRAAGATRIYLGLEGGDAESMAYYHRGISLEAGLAAIRICEVLGFEVDVGFIMFYPHQTLEGILRMTRVFRTHRLVESNSWPFRPLVVNKGSFLEHEIREQGLALPASDTDMDFMRIPWRYVNGKVQVVAALMESFATTAADLMYTLKTVAKKSWDLYRDAERLLAERIVKDSALLHLAVLEKLAACCLSDKSSPARAEEVIAPALGQLDEIVERIRLAVDRGTLKDRDGNIAAGIAAFRSRREGKIHEAAIRCVGE